MADYGQALGLAYSIPQKFLTSPQTQEAGAAPNPVANSGAYQNEAHPLAEREKLTDDYYNNYGVLDTYSKDMAKKGIDVFQPDYSQPGGGQAFKTFQHMQANVMHAANALKNELEMEKLMRKLEGEGHARIRPGTKREGLYYSNPENFYSTAISPSVLESNKEINQETNTPQDAARVNQLQRGPQLHHLLEVKKRLIAEGRPTDEIDNDIAALSTNVDRQDPSVLAAWVRKVGGGGSSYDTNLYKKFWNEGAGNSENYKPEASENGAVLVNRDPSGDEYGYYDYKNPKTNKVEPIKMVIDYLYEDPDKPGKTFIKFKDDNVPDEQVDNPSVYARKVFRHNESKYGDISKIMNQLGKEGKVDTDTGDVREDLLNSPVDKTKIYHELSGKHGAVKTKQEQIKKDLVNLDTGIAGIGRDYKIFDTPDGQIKVGKNSDGTFYIKNGGPFKKTIDKQTFSQINKELLKHGVYNEVVSSPEEESPKEEIVVVEKDGEKFNLPRKQLPQAIVKGYTLVK